MLFLLIVIFIVFQSVPSCLAEEEPHAARTDSSGVPSELEPIAVTVERSHKPHIDISPSIGATVYSIDQTTLENLSQGNTHSFDEVLTHLPGVSEDSKASGGLHIRGEHGNVQYRINGIQLPENLSGFGSAIDTRFVSHLNFMAGALPAQYGLHTAGVIDIETREGKLEPGGQIEMVGGSHRHFSPSAQLFGGTGSVSWYLSASGLRNDQGIENPTSSQNAIHDQTQQSRTFGNFSWYIDDSAHADLLFGTYQGHFQIPDRTGIDPTFTFSGSGFTTDSSALNARQNEQNRFFALSYQQNRDHIDYQISAFHQTSELHYLPDPNNGDLLFTGASGDLLRLASSNGLQFDASLKTSHNHTLRFGAAYNALLTASKNLVTVFPSSDKTTPQNSTSFINDSSSLLGTQTSVFLQDEWLARETLTINYGGRYDRVNAFISESQFNPRLNAVWKFHEHASLHAGYARYFTPPPQELVSQETLNLFANTSNAPASSTSDPVKAERSHYFDIGISYSPRKELSLSVDTYFKRGTNILDEGQFGNALILTPYNYASGTNQGIESSFTWTDQAWSMYANLAWARATASQIISGQALFSASELNSIATQSIFLDHDQRWTASSGGVVRIGDYQFSADLRLGSGLRKTGSDGIPNGDHLPGYGVIDLSAKHSWKMNSQQEIEARCSILNITDRIYELRDGSGVGVGAPQFGLRRSIFGTLTFKL